MTLVSFFILVATVSASTFFKLESMWWIRSVISGLSCGASNGNACFSSLSLLVTLSLQIRYYRLKILEVKQFCLKANIGSVYYAKLLGVFMYALGTISHLSESVKMINDYWILPFKSSERQTDWLSGYSHLKFLDLSFCIYWAVIEELW